MTVWISLLELDLGIDWSFSSLFASQVTYYYYRLNSNVLLFKSKTSNELTNEVWAANTTNLVQETVSEA